MNPKGRKLCIICLTGAIVSLPIIAGFAVAGSYPVTGKWTYENPHDDGPARECGSRYMEFAGDRRFDTDGGWIWRSETARDMIIAASLHIASNGRD